MFPFLLLSVTVVRFLHCFGRHGRDLAPTTMTRSIFSTLDCRRVTTLLKAAFRVASRRSDLLWRDRSPRERSWPRAHGGAIWSGTDSNSNAEKISAELHHGQRLGRSSTPPPAAGRDHRRAGGWSRGKRWHFGIGRWRQFSVWRARKCQEREIREE